MGQVMRILFYLPVVTPWWFERIIVPLIEKLVVDNEVHILAPIAWAGTGLGQKEYDLCAHMPQIAWHIVTDQDHPSMRTDAAQREQIIDFVNGLKPDFVLCRSADFAITAAFPGIVRHIVEGGADPLRLPPEAIHFSQAPFDHALLPSLDEEQIAQLNALIEPYWARLLNAPQAQLSAQTAFRKWACLPEDRLTIFLPLEYEHEENFYTQHRVGPRPNACFVEDILERLDGRAFLALTNHPLNDLHVDNSALEQMVAAHSDHARLFPGETPHGHRSTALMMRIADGVLLGDSKSYALAGFCGTPIMRQSRFETGDWLNACDDLETFVAALPGGKAARPDASMARLWFAFHAANNLISPRDHNLTGRDLLEGLTRPVDPARWERNLGVFASKWHTNDEIAA